MQNREIIEGRHAFVMQSSRLYPVFTALTQVNSTQMKKHI